MKNDATNNAKATPPNQKAEATIEYAMRKHAITVKKFSFISHLPS